MILHCDPNGRGVITKEAFIAFNRKKKFDWGKNSFIIFNLFINWKIL